MNHEAGIEGEGLDHHPQHRDRRDDQPRSGRRRRLGALIGGWPGAVVVTSTKTELAAATGGLRAQTSPRAGAAAPAAARDLDEGDVSWRR